MNPSRPAILVLDDDPDLRELLRRLLSEAGYDVVLAESAPQARACVLERSPDLILADINMPGENGVEFVASLRGDAAQSRIPVVYLTALEEDTELAVRTLGFPLLAKPVVARDLLQLIARQLRPSAQDVVAAVQIQKAAGD